MEGDYGSVGLAKDKAKSVLSHSLALTPLPLLQDDFRSARDMKLIPRILLAICLLTFSVHAAKQPNVVLILADEPVSSLDPETAERIIGFLKKICIDDNITAILSLHQVELARKFADRIVGISTGRISFDEHPEDVTMERLRILYGAGVLEG